MDTLTQLFCFLSNIDCQEPLETIQQTETKKKKKFSLECFIMLLIALCDTFLNKISISKSFCALRWGFQRAIYDASKFFLALEWQSM